MDGVYSLGRLGQPLSDTRAYSVRYGIGTLRHDTYLHKSSCIWKNDYRCVHKWQDIFQSICTTLVPEVLPRIYFYLKYEQIFRIEFSTFSLLYAISSRYRQWWLARWWRVRGRAYFASKMRTRQVYFFLYNTNIRIVYVRI